MQQTKVESHIGSEGDLFQGILPIRGTIKNNFYNYIYGLK